MRPSHLVLIPKETSSKSLPAVTDFRPITLLSTDYKILARILARRLEMALRGVVGEHQTCGFKGRSINTNLHRMRTACEAAEMGVMPIAILQLDLRKAFDQVDRTFLFTLLRHCGIGETMMEWLETCYADITTSVMLGGALGPSIEVSRSVRQGCPMSPVLFALYLEPLCRMIATSNSIRGLVLGNEELRVLAYADDIAVVCTSRTQVSEVAELARRFCRFSGAELNLSKSEGYWLGEWELKPPSFCGARWKDTIHRYLGVNMALGEANAARWRPRLTAAEAKLQPWRTRHIALVARAHICNVVVYPV